MSISTDEGKTDPCHCFFVIFIVIEKLLPIIVIFVFSHREVDYNVADVANVQAPSSSNDGNANIPDQRQDAKGPSISSQS